MNQKGIGFLETLISILILSIALGTMLGSFVIGRVGATKTKQRIEAMNLLRKKAEELRNIPYSNIVSVGATNISIDIGPDVVEGTTDDLVGTITVEVRDKNDFDGDGGTSENEIDIDGDGINDLCKPVHITISWISRRWGGTGSVSMELSTIISN